MDNAQPHPLRAGQAVEPDAIVSDAIHLYKELLNSKAARLGLKTALGFDYIRQGQIRQRQAEGMRKAIARSD